MMICDNVTFTSMLQHVCSTVKVLPELTVSVIMKLNVGSSTAQVRLNAMHTARACCRPVCVCAVVVRSL